MTASRRALIVAGVLVAVALGLPWGGSVREASAQGIQVISATPPSADQGTFTLPVTIKGNGFKKGAKAKFYLTGTTNPAGISVSSTRFIDSTQLIATIDISGTAEVAGFDIVVQNTDGRTGKGTELFKVTAKIDPCTLPDPQPTPSAYVTDQPGYPGYLDGTFGSGTGRVVGPLHLSAQSAAIDSQGRIVLVGGRTDACAPSSARSVWIVARYLPTGALDPTFGPDGDGVVTMAFSNNSVAEAVAIQPDGKILVGGGSPASRKGNAAYRPTIARYNADGSLDTDFGTGGIVLVPGTSWGVVRAIAIQGDGNIVAVGQSDYQYALVVRLLPDGSLDGTFGTSGQRLLNTENDGVAKGWAVAIQTIGSEQYVLVGGTRMDTPTNRHIRFALWRLTSSGTPDTSFGTSGVVVTAFQFPDAQGQPTDSYADQLTGIAVDSDNGIVAAGYMDETGNGYAVNVELARYDVSGTLDPAFGDGGKVVLLSQSPVEFATAVGIQRDGRIVLGGWGTGPPAAIVWRLDAFGGPDSSFGVSGRVDLPIANGASLVAADAMVLFDGKIISAGNILVRGTPDLRFAFVSRVWQ